MLLTLPTIRNLHDSGSNSSQYTYSTVQEITTAVASLQANRLGQLKDEAQFISSNPNLRTHMWYNGNNFGCNRDGNALKSSKWQPNQICMAFLFHG
tara:strand:- start:1663 stop:1950 length:288 start_codon:yes stop_codon:yes gene_type:complete